ncbi:MULTISPECIES: nuclear transport factor 2 family protein [unclassified Streptomyces]|uniref:nuclear transport factor 2 family protein n=1 Tax=unclassified Streptomyces TaxID=2593676 RepID=UPI003819D4AC
MSPSASARRVLVAVLAAAALTATAAVPALASASPSYGGQGYAAVTGSGSHRLAYQKDIAVRVLKGVFEQGDASVVDRYVRPDYIQHNPVAPDGSEPLKNLAGVMRQQFPDLRYDVKRVISEGDLVIVHSNLVLTPGAKGSAVFDIFRFQGGKIAEHWDTVQDVPETSANGNDMFSTVTWPRTEQPGPARLTAYNKKLVSKAFDQLLVRKDLTALDRYWGSGYQQHNPTIPNGIPGVKAGLGSYFAQFPELKVEPKRVIAEGDLVAVHSNYIPAPGQRGQAIIDLFRVQGGKIVEHWDVVQDVPEKSANDNTMF